MHSIANEAAAPPVFSVPTQLSVEAEHRELCLNVQLV